MKKNLIQIKTMRNKMSKKKNKKNKDNPKDMSHLRLRTAALIPQQMLNLLTDKPLALQDRLKQDLRKENPKLND